VTIFQLEPSSKPSEANRTLLKLSNFSFSDCKNFF